VPVGVVGDNSVVGLASFQLYWDADSAYDSASVVGENEPVLGQVSFLYFGSDSDSESDSVPVVALGNASEVGVASFQLYFGSDSVFASDSASVVVNNETGLGLASFQYFGSDYHSVSASDHVVVLGYTSMVH